MAVLPLGLLALPAVQVGGLLLQCHSYHLLLDAWVHVGGWIVTVEKRRDGAVMLDTDPVLVTATNMRMHPLRKLHELREWAAYLCRCKRVEVAPQLSHIADDEHVWHIKRCS
jgi:hypothetical protein